ncbi:MAG TPA: DUF5067 domain-containing protein [Candidatus Mediterraneibacter norfolkensis]|nr:DUF5067 domain-containing protein [Candidatus Mediterraneibacter norfolkensis]
MEGEEMKKKKGGCLKVILVVIVIIVALVIIASVAGGGEKTPQRVDNTSQEQNNEQSETEELDNESQEQTKFGIGETAEMNDVQVTLVDYEESNGSEYNTPADGNVFVLVNFEIANNSDSEINVSSMMSFEAYADDYSLNYSLNAMMEKSDATQLDGTIAPGKKMNGYIGYEVPADWTAMEIHFTDDVWSNNKFVFEITK